MATDRLATLGAVAKVVVTVVVVEYKVYVYVSEVEMTV